MSDFDPPKKDLTSLIELSAKELSNPDLQPALEMPASTNLNEADFESLDDFSKNSSIAESLSAISPDTGQSSANEPPVGANVGYDTPPPAFDVPTDEGVGLEIPQAMLPDSDVFVDSSGLEEPGPAPSLEEGVTGDQLDTTPPNLSPVSMPEAVIEDAPALVAAPPSAESTKKSDPTPNTQKQDLSGIKTFGEKIAIGHPRIEAFPAFSMMIKSSSGHFDEKTIQNIEAAITSEDFGIRLEDISIQLSAGKLLVPQVSEYAAILLAMKLRDCVENIEIDLASEIFKSSTLEGTDTTSPIFLMDRESFHQDSQEVHDLGAEPKSESDLFISNLSEISGIKVTRILTALTVSEIISAEIAENPTDRAFEKVTDRLSKELIARAFKLGAHGVIGLSFNLHPIASSPPNPARPTYRLLASGTAVRTLKSKT